MDGARKRLGVALDAITTVAILLTCGLLAWTTLQRQSAGRPRRPEAPLPSQPQSLAGAQLRGNPKAAVALIIDLDFQCPFCAAFARDLLPDIDKTYVATGKVLLAFRHFPLAGMHPFALRAAEGAECAGRQGKFWEIHDRLFQSPNRLGDSDLLQYGREVALDVRSFEQCLSGSLGASVVQADLNKARDLSVASTPTFFPGTVQPNGGVKVAERITGYQPVEVFRTALDKLLEVR